MLRGAGVRHSNPHTTPNARQSLHVVWRAAWRRLLNVSLAWLRGKQLISRLLLIVREVKIYKIKVIKLIYAWKNVSQPNKIVIYGF